MKKILKIAVMLAIVMIICMPITCNYVYALDDSEEGGVETDTSAGADTVLMDPDDYEPYLNGDPSADAKLEDIADSIVTIIRNVGIVIAVIALMVIGVKTMIGSVEEKSAYKQALPGYLLGVFMVVAMSLIPSIIYSLVKKW